MNTVTYYVGNGANTFLLSENDVKCNNYDSSCGDIAFEVFDDSGSTPDPNIFTVNYNYASNANGYLSRIVTSTTTNDDVGSYILTLRFKYELYP